MKNMKHALTSLIYRLYIYLSGEEQLYYINGADVLPTPLEKEDEQELILHLGEDPSVRDTLVEHNLRLVVYIAKKFENTGINIEDLISIGTIGLIKAINTFRADKSIKLATYASRCIENEILMFMRKTAGMKQEVSFDEPLNVDRDGNELLLSDVLGSEEDTVFSSIEFEEDRRTVRKALEELDERERVIIELRYGLCGGKEHTQKEVADMLGISQSYISRLEKKIIERLKDRIGALI
ncbi:MAG: RNA polymerase sporulation sigma factor SigE [Clostridia bacterium]|nr:RNA polymerase sporulation sigma factor SigE [Clostridia bacterium]MBQ8399026.1 RNA polymerase sporulation sigma factor SigE [Clostridia bacterium]